MLTVVFVLGALVAAVFAARRLAAHPAVTLVRDLGIAVFLIGRFLYRGGCLLARLVAGEVRSW
jgi:hypothetical protein